MLVSAVIVVLSVCLFKQISCDDILCAINGRKSVNTVDDRFLSLSIDPAALITGINIKTPIFSYTSLLLAQHLNPSFVRIAGPSTEFLTYSKDGDSVGLTVTPSMWQSMNEWFTMANLTPIFAINDNEKVNGAWNPKPFYPLLDLTDKLDVPCLWQLGFDSSCKTLHQYKADLLTLKHIIDTFPSKKSTWRIVGSDVSGYAYNVTNAKHFLQTLRGQIDYFMYENASLQSGDSFPDMTMRTRLAPKGNCHIWTTAPKSQHAVTFASALEWAQQIGDAARGGYSVIFRQPRLHEFFVDTPTYWVSLLHKHLMGRKVLEVRHAQEKTKDFHVYAHCTRRQNDFSKLGAITIMLVNNETTPNTLNLRIGSGKLKKIMIHSYILSTTHEKSINTYLNGKKLSMEILEESKLNLSPKLRRAHVTKFLSLPLPEKSIGFFVLPAARVPVCVNQEYNIKLLMQEIREDQNIKFESEEEDENYENSSLQTTLHSDEPVDFNEIFKQIEEELESDENYYKNFQYERETTTVEPPLPPIIKDFKRETKQKRRIQPKKLLTMNLKIDDEELRGFLREKLRARAEEKQLSLTSEEIDDETDKIAKKVASVIMRGKPRWFAKEEVEAKPLRDTRDINMNLVRMRASRPKSSHHFQHKSNRNEEERFPGISSRRRDEAASTHRHSSRRRSQSGSRAGPRFQPRTHNFRHSSLLRPHRLKEKRDSKEGLQDAFEFMDAPENRDASIADSLDNFGRNDDFFADNFAAPRGFDDDDLDFAFPVGQPLDYAEDDYYELEIYPDDQFMRNKRKREAQRSNSLVDERYHYIFGKPVDPSKIHFNPKQKEHQLKLLRQRLSRRKKLDSIQRKVRPADSRRVKRSGLELSLQAKYKRYVPKTKHLKQWKPSDILKLGMRKLKEKRSIDSSENKIDNTIVDVPKKDPVEEHAKVPGVIPVLNSTAERTESSTSSTPKSIESEAETASNCMSNEECLNLILGTSLEPGELLKPGWIGKMYSKVVNFLGKLQKDIVEVMID